MVNAALDRVIFSIEVDRFVFQLRYTVSLYQHDSTVIKSKLDCLALNSYFEFHSL